MKKRLLSLALLLALILPTACGETDGETKTNDTTDSQTTSAPVDEEYVFPRWDGKEFRVLNADDIYSMHAKIDPGVSNGDMLNDAEYNRCRALEDKTGVKFVETNKGVDDEVIAEAQKAILAGDDTYDVIFVPACHLNTLFSEGYLNNLLDLDVLKLDREWWLSSYNDPSVVNGKLWSAASYAQLMIIDSVWSVYYNETIGEKLGLDLPYQLVRDGKWTLDAIGTYMKSAASLNGDDSFTWNTDGYCVYGIAIDHPQHIVTCAGERTIESKDGKLVFTAGTSRYYSVISKIVNVFTENDGAAQYKRASVGDDDPGHYVYTFEHERSLMMIAEVSKTNRMRDKDYSFGLLPLPKYDENQENYIGKPFYGTPCLSIPVTVSDPGKVAEISDALAYLSYKDVWGVFRKVTLEQKNLRNEDSIEMLDILINSIVPDLPTIYNVGSDLEVAVKNVMMDGSDSVASVVASYEDAIKTKLDELNK